MRILIACDKFKGTLSAAEANQAIAQGLTDDQLQCQAIADGGEGTAALLGEALGGRAIDVPVLGALGDSITAQLWLVERSVNGKRLAIFDMCAASGLQLIPVEQRNPWRASTYGTGQLLLAANSAGAEQVMLGLGGSATNDGGAGFAQALGFEFQKADGQPITNLPADLALADQLIAPIRLNLPQVVALSDVSNPLLGTDGATRTFGPQKGIAQEDLEHQEQRLEQLVELTAKCLGSSYQSRSGAGAAGGLGFGLMSFAKGTIEPGFDLLAETLQLDAMVGQADLVITGEGSLDMQSLHGKGPAALAAMAKKHRKPCIALCGRTDDNPALSEHFAQVLPLVAQGADAPKNSASALALLASSNRASWSDLV